MAKATKSKSVSLVTSGVYGIVKWFNKGTGRITIKDYGDVFIHSSQIIKPAPKCYNPQKFLLKGQTVKCDLLSGPKGLQARKVIVVIDVDDGNQSVTSDIPDSASIGDDYYIDSSSDSDDNEPTKHHNILERDLRGEVLSYFLARGFGFVKTHQYGNIFVHNTDIIFAGETSEKILTPTQFVKCDVARGPKGLMAVNVSVICEASRAVTTGHHSRDSSTSRHPKKQEGPKQAEKQTKPAKQTKKQEPKKEVSQPKQTEILKPKQTPANSISNFSKGDSGGNQVLHRDVFGEVLHYNPLKGFGFIKVPIHGSVFVPKTSLVNCDKLEKQQVVKFDIVKGPKSLMAINLKVISDVPSEMGKKDKDIVESKTKKEPKSKKKTKTEASDIQQLMKQPVSAPSHPFEKPPRPQMPPPTAPPLNPFYPTPDAPYFSDHPPNAPPMLMPYAPLMQIPCPTPFGLPPPYASPPVAVNPPPYPNQMVQMRQTFDKTHISSTKDIFAKPQDPKPSCERRLQEGISKELTCGICEDLLEDPVITPCDHLFCRGCLLEWLPYNAQCPIDRKPLSKDAMTSAPKVIKNLLSKT